MKLNLGCGEKKLEGYTNVDLFGEPDIRLDLSVFPWPFDDNSADEVTSAHFLEHARDYEQTILEIHRILKPGGTLHFKVPHFRNPCTQWHLHLWPFSVFTCQLLCGCIPYQWGGRQLFEMKRVRINYIFIPKWIGAPLSFFANIYPMAWDWLGLPIDEIEFTGKKL
ncbi:MAG: class I SAM-dependent methyltransferase [Kiritimatiellaeota bacterium]|nr:class I SAM-dependent methyltransferase [Kiritimatiellota bacterium]